MTCQILNQKKCEQIETYFLSAKHAGKSKGVLVEKTVSYKRKKEQKRKNSIDIQGRSIP